MIASFGAVKHQSNVDYFEGHPKTFLTTVDCSFGSEINSGHLSDLEILDFDEEHPSSPPTRVLEVPAEIIQLCLTYLSVAKVSC